MDLTSLLQHREALLRQAQLANLGYAYHRLGEFAARIERAGLRGLVRLEPADPGTEKYWPALVALEGHQSVIEEHFTDEDVMELTDLLAFVMPGAECEATFRLEQLAPQFMAPLGQHLQRLGVAIWAVDATAGEMKPRH